MGLNRRQTGDEVDWLKIAGATGALTGALQRSDKYQDYKKGVKEEENISQAQEKAQTAMDLGVSGEDARTQVLEQTRYKEPGFIGKITGEKGTYERSFSPEVAETGYQRAIESQIKSSESTIKKATQDYVNKFAGKTPDEMQSLDTTKMPNPAAATAAKSKYFLIRGKSAEAQKFSNEQHKLVREGLYKKFKSAQMTADSLLKDPTTVNRNKGVNLMVDATNKLNNTAYQAEKVTMKGEPMVRAFIMYDGERRDGDLYTPEEYQKVLNGITKELYYQAFDNDAELSKKLNKESLENPDYMVNKKGEILRVQTFRKPLGPEHQYLITTSTGDQYPIQDRQELLKKGFVKYIKPKAGKAGASSKKLTNNIKVLKEAMELVKQRGRYNIDPDTGIVTEIATGNEAGPELIREAIKLMPQLGVALETGDIKALLKHLDIPEEDDIAGTLLNTRTPTPVQPALNRGNTVTPLTNPELQELPLYQ